MVCSSTLLPPLLLLSLLLLLLLIRSKALARSACSQFTAE